MNRNKSTLVFFLLLWLVGCQADPVAEQLAAGNDAFAREAYEQAVVAYQEAEQLDPMLAEPLYNRANGLYRQGVYTDTVTLLPRASSLADTQLESFALYNLGNSYFQMEQWVEAIEAYKATLRIDPNDRDAKYNLELAVAQLGQQGSEGEEPGEDGEDGEQQSEEESEDGEEQTEQSPSEEEGSDGEEEQQSSGSEEGEEQEQADEADSGNEGENGEEGVTAAEGGEAVRLTEEQARQLLETVGQGTMSLQEKLQQIFVVPGPPPDKDW